MERRGAVGLRDVDVGARAEQRAHGFAVAALRGVDEWVRGLRATTGSQAKKQKRDDCT